MNFPEKISLTVTNACNLRCRMCGQWSEEGYINNAKENLKQKVSLTDWKRIIDELVSHDIQSVLIRGGEPFLLSGIIELLDYIHDKGMSVSIDTNGTLLKEYAADILRIGNIHLTISVDGPEEIHDKVRGIKGCFKKIKEGLAFLTELEKNSEHKISRSICFTISPYSVAGLGEIPDVARDLGIGTVTIVPYYYVPEKVGSIYETELRESLDCPAFSWHGFHHESSGVNFARFIEEFRKFKSNLGDLYSYPYMDLSEEEYKTWFDGPMAPVGAQSCLNVEKLIDIQPNGEANFCVDFPDYSIGNIRDATIAGLWNGEMAERFREYRRQKPLAVCHRCGSKHMSEDIG